MQRKPKTDFRTVEKIQGHIFSIERFALDDGPGIRTLVFFKGCPLRCLWCSNPEGQSPRAELVIFPKRCIGCGACVASCPHGAARLSPGGEPAVDRDRCQACRICGDVCHAGARRIYGTVMSSEELFKKIACDSPFYRESSGGVTLSGGEPLLQWRFAREILRRCREEGIHTAIETCGHYPWHHLEQCLPYLDWIFLDLKHMRPNRHRELTRRDNRLILENARKLFSTDVLTMVRYTVVPGCNDEEDNLKEMVRFLKDYPKIEVELLPYHEYGVHKYKGLHLSYGLEEAKPPGEDHLQRLCRAFQEQGIACRFTPPK